VRILVTGGTGFVGGHTAVAAQRAGHEIRLLVRDAAKAERVAGAVGLDAAEVVIGDVTDVAAVKEAVQGCDAVLHAAGAVSLDPRQAASALRTNEEGARNVLGAAVDHGVTRVVHVSSTSALRSSGAPLAIDAPVATGGGYAASKAAAERIARELQAQQAPVHITYPSGVIGPAAGPSLGETSTSMARFVASGVLPTPGASLSLIDVRDLAQVHVRLLAGESPPARVMCGGACLTMRELGALLRASTGRRFPVLPLPPGAWRLLGRVLDRVTAMVPVRTPISEEAMTLVTTWSGTEDNAPALGIDYRPIGDSLAESIASWVDAGLLTARQAGAAAP
jgi:nucleoside-diphosphate-sugar epimerase